MSDDKLNRELVVALYNIPPLEQCSHLVNIENKPIEDGMYSMRTLRLAVDSFGDSEFTGDELDDRLEQLHFDSILSNLVDDGYITLGWDSETEQMVIKLTDKGREEGAKILNESSNG